jgi:2-dehydro-3-deoxyglucarate aldolase/4-hydroxy-2-oxoheptanedioate aldolase
MFQKFRRRLLAGEQLLGTLISLPSPEAAEIAASTGYDWLFIDGEHGALDALLIQRMLQAVGDRCPCLVRVPLADEISIKRVLDVGAAGVIVPQVNTVAQAEAVVRCCRYPPQGGRGVGIARAHGYGGYFGEYVAHANEDVSVVIQAEHIDAVENIEGLAAVAGVDAIFVGPYDLSASMGRMGQVADPDVQAAIGRVASACQRSGRATGIFGLDATAVRGYAGDGFTLLAAGCDGAWLVQGASANLQGLRGG